MLYDPVTPAAARATLTILILMAGLVAGAPAPLHAQGFAGNLHIDVCDHTTIVTVRSAWTGAPDLVYALVPPGAPPPAADQYDAVITTPVRRVVSLASTNIPHLRDLGALHTLVGVDTGDHIYDETVTARIADGEVRQVGAGGTLDLERVLALNPDLVLITAFGPDDAALTRLRHADVPTLVVADWREADPLGRAEWVRLFGALLGRSREADRLFAARSREYQALRDAVAAQINAGRVSRPTILANGPWQGQWPVPAGESYMARLFADAGGAYLWGDTTGAGSIFLDLEAVIARAAGADFWINLNFDWHTREDISRADPRLAVFAPFRTGNLYHHIRRVRPSGANDFWETGLSRPDIVLRDLVWVLHGADLAGVAAPVYYRRVE